MAVKAKPTKTVFLNSIVAQTRSAESAAGQYPVVGGFERNHFSKVPYSAAGSTGFAR
jgi:hypothetical protein